MYKDGLDLLDEAVMVLSPATSIMTNNFNLNDMEMDEIKININEKIKYKDKDPVMK